MASEHTRYRKARTCESCGHAVGGVIVLPWGDEDVTVHCSVCTDPDASPEGVYVKPRQRDEDRWHPGSGVSESMSP